MELHEIVMKLVGPVQPSGDSRIDAARLANMETLIALADELIGEISLAAHSATRHEASMKAIGKRARRFLDELATASPSSAA